MSKRSKSNNGISELRLSGKVMDDLVEQHWPSKFTNESPKFKDYAWDDFDPKQVLSLLLSTTQSYDNHLKILFNGFCTWVLCRDDKQLIKNSMLLAGIEALIMDEQKAFELIPESRLAGAIVSRIKVDQDFYKDFYYPIGGIKTIIHCPSLENIRKQLRQSSDTISTVVMMMQVFHYHANNLQSSGKYRATSLKKGKDTAYAIWKRRKNNGLPAEGLVVPDNMDDRWQKYKTTVALIYSASTITLDSGRNLLSVIISGEADFELHGPQLATWVGRARWATESILAHLFQNDIAKYNRTHLPAGKNLHIATPNFDSEEKKMIRDEFRK